MILSNRSYHQKSHTGARRRGHKAQSVSDNGAEDAWPASSRMSVQVADEADKEQKAEKVCGSENETARARESAFRVGVTNV